MTEIKTELRQSFMFHSGGAKARFAILLERERIKRQTIEYRRLQHRKSSALNE